MHFKKSLCLILLFLFSIFFLHKELWAESIVVFKYFNKDKYIAYINSAEANYIDNSMHGLIMNQFLQGNFDLNKVPKEYYTLSKQDGLSFFGFTFTQYIIAPKKNDRFRHILWFDNKNKLLKVEVFDNLNMLLFAFGSFDFMKGYVSPSKEEPTAKGNVKKDIKPSLSKKTKFKFKHNEEFFKGFYHFRTVFFNDSALTLSFNDGVNNISLFIKAASAESKFATTIAYGNYLIKRVIEDLEYTVYGTVPFALMEEILQIISNNYEAIYRTAVEGKQLTKAIYSK